MNIAFAEHTIELHTWENKGQMVNFLAQCEAGNLLLGENSEQERQFHTAVIRLGTAGLAQFGIGICSQGHGLTPTVLLRPNESKLLFGFNSEVVGIDLVSKQIAFTLPLDALFHAFLPLDDQNLVLVVHEIGTVALTWQGEAVWQFDEDIITNVTLEKDRLYFEFMDSSPIYLNFADMVTKTNAFAERRPAKVALVA